jgi:hypothetical protein
MCAQPDNLALSVMLGAHWSIAMCRKLRFDAHRLIVPRDLTGTGHTTRRGEIDGGDPEDAVVLRRWIRPGFLAEGPDPVQHAG